MFAAERPLGLLPPNLTPTPNPTPKGAHCIDCRRPASMYAVQAAVHDDAVCRCDHCGGLVKPDIVVRLGRLLVLLCVVGDLQLRRSGDD